VADLAVAPGWPLLPLVAFGLAPWLRRAERVLALATLGLLAADVGAHLHRAVGARRWPDSGPSRVAARLREVEARGHALIASLGSLAARVASLPETAAALDGDRGSLTRLFHALAERRPEVPERPALAVHALPLATVAWSGRIVDLGPLRGLVSPQPDVFIVTGSVSTTLVATAPVVRLGGATAGLVTAEVTVSVRRNIRNEFLSDYDLLAQTPDVEVSYVDLRDTGPGPAPVAQPEGQSRGESFLRAPDGGLLAVVRVAADRPSEIARRTWSIYRRLGSLLSLLVLVAWIAPACSIRRLGIAATAARAALLVLGPPVPSPDSPLLAPEAYASSFLGSAGGALLRSPVDLLLTAAWLLVLTAAALDPILRRPVARPTIARVLAADLLSLPPLAAVFAWVGDTSANSTLDLEAITLIPRSAAHLLIHLALLLVLAGGGLLLTCVQALAGSVPASPAGRVARVAGWTIIGGSAFHLWPRDVLGLPLLPAVALFLAVALLAATRGAWRPRLQAASPGARAGVLLVAVALLSLLLHPSLVHFGEKHTRSQIERVQADLVLGQPQWREYGLRETTRKIDALDLLEETPPSPRPPGLEELAFSVWSLTDLAAFGFSSAVEIQDPAGLVVSRFALNLPAPAASKALPESDQWVVSRDRLALLSAERPVLHARRRLSYHGTVHGAVHVYVGDDFWNLPFVQRQDPYSILFRTGHPVGSRGRPVELLAYDRGRTVRFSSAERPPALAPELLTRLEKAPRGLWTTLDLDDRRHHTFLFGDRDAVYGLCYPRLDAGRFVADLVEAASALTLAALAGLLALVLLRTGLRLPTLSLPSLTRAVAERFSLRLSLAIVALAVVPATVLQVVVRGFVADRLWSESRAQAEERAAVAKKAVEDLASFERGQARPGQPITDTALVWVASLVRNDLDVFERGRLLASSKRELYDSGLLPPRVSGAVFRDLLLHGQPTVHRPERIGGFEYQVVSVPVRIHASEPGILAMPLAPRQREVEAVLEDLDRTIRLATVLFLLAAAALALSMARRISGPLRDLTRATRRVAAGDLTPRVTTASRDEFQALAEAFNQMAGDLDRQRTDLERTNRLAAWAEMARQVAHEVKNPLTPIQLSAEHLRRVYGDPDSDFAATLESCTQTILKQVRTLRGIVTEFTAFARPPADVLEPCDLATLVPIVVQPYQSALPPGVVLVVEVATQPLSIHGDRRLIERAIVNLLENALQAVGESGSIRVQVLADDGRVRIEVDDSGPGIDPEMKDRVFEPFFSTKTGGSGLGLALVKKIAQDHGGGVALVSQPGNGTRASLWFPAARAEGAPPPGAQRTLL
jgi:signal transduction histidine kinase